ncbi:MAG: ParA family protein [Bifidobacteriaceae bacterium]|jgi:chromosome partitioning protein|nr:ParA family protein [Bifidobacteriaceae bacterium]
MTHVVAVINTKGGVGKTTTVMEMGLTLHQMGESVLVRDADPQGNSWDWAKDAKESQHALPFTVEIANKKSLSMPTEQDWVIIDTPPSLVDTIQAAVDASEFVIVPMSPSDMDYRRTMETIRQLDKDASVLITKARFKTIQLAQVVADLDDQKIGRFDTIIPLRESVNRSAGTNIVPTDSNYQAAAQELVEGLR